jgi:transcriptional regulator with XRE-family HTH domain
MTTDFASNFRLITAGHSVGEIAARTGIDHGSVSRYQQGKREPTLTRLKLIALAFDVSADSLLGIERTAA